MSFHVSGDFGVWCAALLTLFIFSFLYKDNPFYKFAEHLFVGVSAGYPGTKEWVQQVQARFHLPMIAGVTAVSAPEYYPYLQARQLLGLLGGMAGAAEYEKARHEHGKATRGMDAQSMAHFFVAFCILLGNLVQWTKGRRTAP